MHDRSLNDKQPNRPLINFHPNAPVAGPGLPHVPIETSVDAVRMHAVELIALHAQKTRKGRGGYEERRSVQTHHASVHLRTQLWWSHATGAVETLDVAAVNVFAPYQRQGFFTKMMDALEQEAERHSRVVRVHNVLLDFTQACMVKRGYIVSGQCPQTYYRLPVSMR